MRDKGLRAATISVTRLDAGYQTRASGWDRRSGAWKGAGWLAASAVVAAVVLVAQNDARAAGSLDEALQAFFDGDCPGAAATGPLLGPLCSIPENSGSSSSGGTASAMSSSAVVAKRVRRLHDEGDVDAADEDIAEMTFQGLNIFATVTYEAEDKDRNRFEDGHNSDRFGIAVGADAMVSDNALLGAALGFDHEDGEFDSGGDFKIYGYRAVVFGSVLPTDQSFIDLYGGFTWREHTDINRRIDFSFDDGGSPESVTGETDADTSSYEVSAGIAGGYHFSVDNITFGPRAALDYRYMNIDSYKEDGTTGLELDYEEFDEDSLTGKLGAQAQVAISTGFGVLVPQVSAFFVHEFLLDQQSQTASLVFDLNNVPLNYENEEPDRNYAEFGAGVAVVLTGGISGFANYSTTQFNTNFENHLVEVGFRLEW